MGDQYFCALTYIVQVSYSICRATPFPSIAAFSRSARPIHVLLFGAARKVYGMCCTVKSVI